MRARNHHKVLVLLVCLSLSSAAWSSDRVFNPSDPYERYNRKMFVFNNQADHYVMRPMARGYRAVVPKPVRYAITNFFNNLRDVVSFGSNVLRGSIENAGYDFMRVAVNSTFGLGGLINIADEAGMPDNKNTLGDVFAAWGWKNSHYLVMPLTGPSTLRDGLGSVITTLYSPTRLVKDTVFRYASTSLDAVRLREQLLDVTDALADMNAPDSYAYTRDLFMSVRNHQVGNQTNIEEESIDDLIGSSVDPAQETSSNPPLPEVVHHSSSVSSGQETPYVVWAKGALSFHDTPSEHSSVDTPQQPLFPQDMALDGLNEPMVSAEQLDHTLTQVWMKSDIETTPLWR